MSRPRVIHRSMTGEDALSEIDEPNSEETETSAGKDAPVRPGLASTRPQANSAPPPNKRTSKGPLESVLELLRTLRLSLDRTRQSRDDLLNANDKAVSVLLDAHNGRINYESVQRTEDPRRERRGSLPWAVVLMLSVVIFDVLPAYWGAQALDEGVWSTRIITTLLVLSLLLFSVLLSYFKHQKMRTMFWVAFAATGLMIGVQTGLRLQFLIVTENAGGWSVGLQVTLLAAVSTVLVVVGYFALLRAEPVSHLRLRFRQWRRDRKVKKARGQLEEAATTYFDQVEALRNLDRSRFGEEEELLAEIRREFVIADELDMFRRKVRDAGPVIATNGVATIETAGAEVNEHEPDEGKPLPTIELLEEELKNVLADLKTARTEADDARREADEARQDAAHLRDELGKQGPGE